MNPITSQTGGDERLLLLAMALDTRTGLTFDQIADRGLLGDPGDVEPESLRRTFLRYREQLEEMGVRVVEVDYGAGPRYKVDARYTYAEPGDIDLAPNEALTLVTLLSLYLEGANTPYTQDVRRARDKIASIAGLVPAPVGAAGRAQAAPTGEARAYAALVKAYTNCQAASFVYTNAHGVSERKTVCVYGMFERMGHTYAVALDQAAQETKVFRCDRVDARSVKVDPRATYRIPADFCVDDYMRLPFQYGEGPAFEAAFGLRAGAKAATCKALTQGKGTWDKDPLANADATWRVEALDLDALARWAAGALQAGLVALAPNELVQTMVDGLRKAAGLNG